MAPGVRVIDRGWNRIQRAFRRGGGEAAVRVGVQGPDAADTEHDGNITNVQLMGVHEFGAPSRNIPERSVFRSTFDKNRKKYERELKDLGRDLVRGTTTRETGLTLLGEGYRADMLDRVRRAEIKQDLSERTRKQRGEDGPALWDTGQMMGAISSKVER